MRRTANRPSEPVLTPLQVEYRNVVSNARYIYNAELLEQRLVELEAVYETVDVAWMQQALRGLRDSPCADCEKPAAFVLLGIFWEDAKGRSVPVMRTVCLRHAPDGRLLRTAYAAAVAVELLQ